MKKISNRKKESFLEKLSILATIMLGCSLVSMFFPNKDIYKIFLMLFLIIGLITVLLVWLFNINVFVRKNKFKKSDKYILKSKNFDIFYKEIAKVLKSRKYKIKNIISFNEKETLYLYEKKESDCLIETYVIVNLISLTEKKDEKILNILIENYKQTSSRNKLKIFLIICVQKYSETLETRIKSCEYEYAKDLLMPIGISFSTNLMYIASAKELGLKYTKDYLLLKNEILATIECEKINN